MIYIVLSVLFNATLFIVIKSYKRFEIDTLQALVVNYLTAFFTGMLFTEESYQYSNIVQKPWYLGSLLLGCLFISVFYVTAITSQKNGLSVASVASKMSVVIPILFGIFYFKESIGIFKIIGIILALAAVYLTSKKQKGALEVPSNLWFPAMVFFGAGCIDTFLKIMQTYYVKENDIPLFSANTFFNAFIIGLALVFYGFYKKKMTFKGKNILGGILLGIPNYFALYYMIRMLDNPVMESSTIFTINNIAIVLLVTLVGLIFFKEKITIKNTIGIILAIIAITMVTL